ncbi:Selenocysteine lyase/Cysteine desulfurase [Quadrisphaera granulorum]|uniref:Selenocysteine lyase/cysteine desulfurase n=1 Tax=Quadrisphaera granulorum TaxID=317664 RepID=A0A315ZYB2_9ACTN|nr:aminotransferase class V-fold PLP-dependent enzyme [Quadrisphaera granulorum]PWJ50229.1 selenocysteine lyase/cysteine desulfurase [Quadrisphaera granulorum]SZE97995.1 Selenocysteine lyase/Cysteine desulfurase [Quadrisphaera granulorum]
MTTTLPTPFPTQQSQQTGHRRRDSCPGAGPLAAGPLAALVGADLQVPLVTGGTVRYANLDLAASAPALASVAGRVAEYLPLAASVHRGAGYSSTVATAAYEHARSTIGAFVGARTGSDDSADVAVDVVVITRNTTDALNLLASAVPDVPGTDRPVVHLDLEHHANLLPWQARGARVVTAGVSVEETVRAVDAELRREPAALLAVTGASNVTGELLPLAQLAEIAHAHGARIAVDGAQLLPHRRLDLAASGVDYVAASGHKLYAPFGAGFLAGRRDWLDAAPPHLAGGGAVRNVTTETATWTTSPARHEAGTPNVVGALALAAACETLAAFPERDVIDHEAELLARLERGLAELDAVRVLRLWPGLAVDQRIGVLTFTVEGVRPSLVAQYLSAEHGIGVRDGRFCAHPLLERLGADGGAVRASLGLGSSADDVDRLLAGLRQLLTRGPAWTYGGPEDQPVPDPRPLPTWLPAAALPAGTGSPCGQH